MFKSNSHRSPALLFGLLAAGLALVVFGAYLLRQNVGTYLETTAVITKIDSAPLFSNVYVSYTADGRLYEDVPLRSRAADDEIGRELVVYYDPEDPSVIESQGGSAASQYALLIGGLLAIYALISILRSRRTLFVKRRKTT